MSVDERKPYVLVQTSFACPAQWQGLNDSGEWVYLRSRGGVVQIGFGPSIESAIDDAIFAGGYACHVADDLVEWEEILPHYRAALAMHELGATYGRV